MESVDFSNLSGHEKAVLFRKCQKEHTLEELISYGLWVNKEDIGKFYINSLSFYQRFNLSFDDVMEELTKLHMYNKIFVKESFDFILTEMVKPSSVSRFLYFLIQKFENYDLILEHLDKIEKTYEVLNKTYSKESTILADFMLLEICYQIMNEHMEQIKPVHINLIKVILDHHCLNSNNLLDVVDEIISVGDLELIKKVLDLGLVPKGNFLFHSDLSTEQIADVINLLESKLSLEDFYKVSLGYIKPDYKYIVFLMELMFEVQSEDKVFNDILD